MISEQEMMSTIDKVHNLVSDLEQLFYSLMDEKVLLEEKLRDAKAASKTVPMNLKKVKKAKK